MSKRKSSKMTDGKMEREKIDDFRNLTWCMNNLSDQEISIMDTMPFDGERFGEFLELCIDVGLDIKVSWDTYSESYQVTVMGAWKGFHNAGFACSARGVDVFDAFRVLWFKISHLANFDLPSFAIESAVRRKRG
jgi:hypothetical protein